jgi:hypothetical protein
LSGLLEFYFGCEDEAEAESYFNVLTAHHASPRISSFFERRVNPSTNLSNDGFSKADAEDMSGKAYIKLAESLKQKREDSLLSSEKQIKNLDAYISGICRNLFIDFLRRRFAEYTKLKNRVRYLLKKDSKEFVYWVEDKQTLCSLVGLDESRSKYPVEEIIQNMKRVLPGYPSEDHFSLAKEACKQAEGWIYLKELVEIISKLLGIEHLPGESFQEDEVLENLNPLKDSERERRKNLYELRSYWEDIKELSSFQRRALLYRLKDDDGDEVNTIWFETGIATLEELAEAFEVKREEMANLLSELPFTDSNIANVLGIEDEEKEFGIFTKEKKVQNLRKTAREFLKRRRDGKQKRMKHK